MYSVYRRPTAFPDAAPTLVYDKFDTLYEAHEFAKLHTKHSPTMWYYVEYRTVGARDV